MLFRSGVSPAVAIEQKNPTTSSRSTVGTATEIYDYLRILWARIGRPYCPACGAPVTVDSPSTAADRLITERPGRQILVCFPLPSSTLANHELILENLRALGFVRVLLGGTVHRIDELPPDTRLNEPGTRVVVDRVKATTALRGRLADSLALAFGEGEGIAEAVDGDHTERFSQHPRCVACDTPAPVLTPTLFSFNSPRGACPGCNGFGAVLEYDESLIVPDRSRSLAQGALDQIGRAHV